jgi:hypothetical protein
MTLKKNLIIHPVLLAVYPVLFLYSHNIGQVCFSDAVEPTIVILVVTVAAWAFLNVFIRSWHKSAMITSFLLLLFFSYGHVRALLGTKISVFSLNWFLYLLFLGGSFCIIRIRKPLEKGTMILNVFGAILVTFTLVSITTYEVATAGRATQLDAHLSDRDSSKQAPQGDAYPDIYFIILDAYARQDILREIYNFDNSDFIKFLRDRGFYVADKCAANYCQTGLSVGSCLNLEYLDVNGINPDSVDQKPLKALIEKGRVHKFLKEHGYKTVSFAASAYCTNLENADFYLKSGTPVNTFYYSVINTTPLPDIIKLKKESSSFGAYRRGILYILNNIGKVPRMHSGPKFVFVHIEVPHPPFVFGPGGEPVITMESRFNDYDADRIIHDGGLSLAQYQKAYCDQVRFINSRMEKVIDEILGNSSRPPIILILGDHGPRSGVIWEDPARTNVKECLTNLGAFYLPGGGEKLLYPDMTLVNLFRVVFNHYFGENFGLLPDRCYFSTAKRFYVFYDVTDRVRQGNKGQPADRTGQ